MFDNALCSNLETILVFSQHVPILLLYITTQWRRLKTRRAWSITYCLYSMLQDCRRNFVFFMLPVDHVAAWRSCLDSLMSLVYFDGWNFIVMSLFVVRATNWRSPDASFRSRRVRATRQERLSATKWRNEWMDGIGRLQSCQSRMRLIVVKHGLNKLHIYITAQQLGASPPLTTLYEILRLIQKIWRRWHRQ